MWYMNKNFHDNLHAVKCNSKPMIWFAAEISIIAVNIYIHIFQDSFKALHSYSFYSARRNWSFIRIQKEIFEKQILKPVIHIQFTFHQIVQCFIKKYDLKIRFTIDTKIFLIYWYQKIYAIVSNCAAHQTIPCILSPLAIYVNSYSLLTASWCCHNLSATLDRVGYYPLKPIY